ncbi:MAG: tetratricopeptide repeat protein [Sphingobium sp.]|uniref:tetratricopeptide repeat protein n=1 Tax=Sphingobium sp. TaxID=1912891 RepID=UPI0029BED5B5|nr:tetratricopeptide repeat protein [Sphingobium sp.]MDX3909068.1 tetratricopeptide repeat protein [Sphingobium sp.]
MNKSALIAGTGLLWLLAMGIGGYVYKVAPPPPLEQADAAVRLAAAQDDKLAFDASIKQLEALSPGLATLRRYENIGRSVMPLTPQQAAEMKIAARKQTMADPMTRDEATRKYAFELASQPATASRGVSILQGMASNGDTAATALLAESLESINIRRAEVGPLWRSIALKRSQAALKTAEFLGFQPRLTLTSYEARDYRRVAERLMRREAADGSITSMVNLGDLLRERGDATDIAQARDLYERSIALGSVRGMVRLAELLLKPGFSKEESERAFRLLRGAVARGSAGASYIMAENYRLGRGVAVDNRKAYAYYRAAARGGSSGAQVRLGDFAADGVLGAPDPKASFEWYARAATGGSASAYTKLAQAYLPGGLMPQNNERAVEYLTEAAKRGSVRAMSELADIYRLGQIVDRDIDLSNEWALRAVNSGSTNNGLRIIAAQAVVVGGTTPAELNRAQDLLNQAIASGSVEARTKLGGLLLSIGDPESAKQATSLFKQAAASGNGEALASLAAIYASGNGVPVDPALSFQYFNLAASRGTAAGFRGMGVAYASGFGVAKDLNKAVEYYKRGAALGDIKATILLAGCYIDGCGSAPQPAKGNALIVSVFGRGNNDVDFQTAILMLKGEAPGSELQALRILKEAARRGYGPARQVLRQMGQFDPREQQKVNEQRRETLLLAGEKE